MGNHDRWRFLFVLAMASSNQAVIRSANPYSLHMYDVKRFVDELPFMHKKCSSALILAIFTA